MEDISWFAVIALLLLVALGWMFHLTDEEPAEFALFGAVVVGIALASTGRGAWVAWLWYGALLGMIALYVIRWMRGWRPRKPFAARHNTSESLPDRAAVDGDGSALPRRVRGR